MKTKFTITALIVLTGLFAFNWEKQQDAPKTTKEILLHQFKTTHTEQEWFTTMNNAVKGLTAEQAAWRLGEKDHSVGQLAYHLTFWNLRLLKSFLEIPQPKFEGENTETFDSFDQAQWDGLVVKLDSVAGAWEKTIEATDEEKLQKWFPTIANMNTHNAYHTGQILYLRKMNNWWDPENGVK